MNRKIFISSGGSLAPEYKIDSKVLNIRELCDNSFDDHDSICIDSEGSLEVVFERLEEGKKRAAINLLKNKFAFRTATASLFPDFSFYKARLWNLKKVNKKSMIKPARGFFSAGVRMINPEDDLDQIKKEISSEVEHLSHYFPESVLSSQEWLIEDWIEGEELAVDMYYDSQGAPVILNITAHPMPSDLNYLNVIYWTSEELMRTWKAPLETFFQHLNDQILHGVTRFPIHGEFRIQKGRLIPIELNPLRFGGFGLGDLSHYGWKFNPYDMFFKGEAPKWEEIWKKSKGKHFCWVLAYNGKNSDPHKYSPDHHRFVSFCGKEHLLHYRKLDARKHPVFALAYLSLKEKKKIDEFLSLDFNQFFPATQKFI